MGLIIIILVVLVGAWPRWPYSRRWGYAPASVLGLVLLVLLVLVLLNYIPRGF
jgi:hypothetical protein